ncbi:EAL domain-containing protein [Alsobacter sp. KACC 23698]|uniref:EAL domain-containing protein n=1 Tax=Alsobacter sp. KACC 23698 TaxID=3149229 RepID=A0AAU7JA23_9HYPH
MTARIVWPVAAVLLSLLTLAVGGLVLAGQRANEISLDRQRASLGVLLDHERAKALRDLAVTVSGGEAAAALKHPMSPDRAQRAIGAALETAYGFDQSFVVTPENVVVTGRADGQPGDQRRFTWAKPLLSGPIQAVRDRVSQLILRRTDWAAGSETPDAAALRSGHARLVFDGSMLRIVAAVALPTTEGDSAFGGLVAVASLPLGPAALQHLSQASGHEGLRVEAGETTGFNGLPVTDEYGYVKAQLVWTPDRPGDIVLERVLPAIAAALLAIGLFSAFMFAHVRTVTTELVTREAEATHLANHDRLSGLPNRAFFSDRLDVELSRLKESGEGLAVMFLDVDKFKDINDNYGHSAGDMLIRIVARRITGVLRGADTLSRFGGDEFAIIQTGVRSVNDCAALAHRILEAIREPVELNGALAYVGVSIGVAMAPDNGEDRDMLMRLADVALYRAKREGRNRYSFFELGMDETLRMRKMVEEDLRNALETGLVDVVYQPQFSPDGRKVLGVEALVRWTHPVHGPISPADFIPVAEQRGLIGMLGEYVLRRACRDGKRWKNITVAVNVSPIQFRQKDFVGTVARIVQDEGMEAGRVELELTEGVLVDDADNAENAMMELRALGLRFALDDFGTGYSSLIYLRRFAFDKIKIDRSFLESMETTGESAILVHSVVHLGRALGLTVTAEGVETTEQQRFLQAVGCHQLQGFLFCKPVPAAKIDELLGLTSELRAPGKAS